MKKLAKLTVSLAALLASTATFATTWHVKANNLDKKEAINITINLVANPGCHQINNHWTCNTNKMTFGFTGAAEFNKQLGKLTNALHAMPVASLSISLNNKTPGSCKLGPDLRKVQTVNLTINKNGCVVNYKL